MLDEFEEVESIVKNYPEFQEALLKKGITDSELVMVDPCQQVILTLKQMKEYGLHVLFAG